MGKVLDILKNGKRHGRRVVLAKCLEKEGQLIYNGRAYVPLFEALCLRLTQLHHDSPSVRHPRRAKTLTLL